MIEVTLKTEKLITDVIYDHYKNMDNLDLVLKENRALLKRCGEYIPAGEVVRLPDPLQARVSVKKRDLWG